MTYRDDRQAEQRAQAVLRAQCEHLDGTTRSKLNQARQRALTQLDKRPLLSRRNGLFAGGMVTASLAAAALWFGGLQLSGSDTQPLPVEVSGADVDMLLVGEEIELLEELDFYNWLQSVPGTPGQETVG